MWNDNLNDGKRCSVPRGRLQDVTCILSLAAIVLILCLAGCGSYTETKSPSTDPKIVALYEANNRLNKMFAHHDWDSIYGMLVEGYQAGVCLKPESYQDQSEERRCRHTRSTA